mmetsp:Transcript_40072/g.114538  ORF Transcript_40072/g.114538 Transcript_40072/m.114538 type:complete len:236 (+) Transcript_40072:435-1142(+)
MLRLQSLAPPAAVAGPGQVQQAGGQAAVHEHSEPRASGQRPHEKREKLILRYAGPQARVRGAERIVQRARAARVQLLCAVTTEVEEERISGHSAVQQPLHCRKHVLPRGLVCRVLLVVGEADNPFAVEAEPQKQRTHVGNVVHTAAQLRRRAKVTHPYKQRPATARGFAATTHRHRPHTHRDVRGCLGQLLRHCVLHAEPGPVHPGRQNLGRPKRAGRRLVRRGRPQATGLRSRE